MNGLANSPDPSPWPLKAVAIAVICAAAFSYTFVPVRACNDVWWHLKTGQLIVERGLSLPRNDEFTFTGENIAWHNHEWLSQVVLYRLFQWGGGRASDLIGLRSVIGVVSVLSVLTFLLVLALVQLRCKCLPIAALITLLALDVSRLNLYPRPPAVSYLFTAFFLLLLCQWKSGRRHARTLLVLPPLTAIWANLHGGFVVGLILVACYLIGEIARHFLVRKRSGANALTHVDADLSEAAILSDEHEPVADHKGAFKSRLLWLSALLTACFLASLCNPYGFHLYELHHRVMSSVVVKMIDEMQSPFRPDVARHFLSLFAMIGVIVVGLGVVRLRARTRPPMADAIVLLFFGCQAVLHTRHLPLFAIAAAPIMGWIVGQLLQNVGRVYRRRIAVGAMAVTLVVAFNWIAMHGLAGGFWRPATWTLALYDRETYIKRNLRLAGGETYVEVNFPKAVCDFVEANKFNGRMLNPVNVAGYLIWRLSPEKHKLFTDNRFDVFGDRFTWDEWAVRGGIEAGDWDRIAWDRAGLSERDGQKVRRLCDSLGWAEILDRWQINFIVAELSWPVCAKLRASQQWAPVFRWLKPPGVDRMDGYEVFVRRIESNSDLIERCRRAAEAAGEIYRVP